MSDMPSALGIEAVELVAEGGRNVTVRVTGRWRRRRPELRGQAMLVVETGTVRQRFVAMPEPPSLTGAAPGTWRMTFTVPAELAPQLPGKTFLQLGAVMVPLPVGEVAPVGEVSSTGEAARGSEAAEGSEASGAAGGPPPDLLEARRLRSSELAAESARRRAAEAEAALAELAAQMGEIEDELGRTREESERLREVIVERDRQLRASEQHMHAERARRGEVEQALTEKTRTASHDLRVLHERVGDLERELERMRRVVDEAQHLAAAAQAARLEAERRVAELPAPGPPAAPEPPAPPEPPEPPEPLTSAEPVPPEPVPPEPAEPAEPAAAADPVRARLIASEFELARAPTRPPAVTPRIPVPPPGDRAALQLEQAMVDRRSARLERELNDARAELAAARREFERQRILCERAYHAIDHVRGELARLGAAAPALGEPAKPPEPAEPPETAARAPAPPEPVQAEPVQAEKLSAALARLRETRPAAPETTTAAPGAPATPAPSPAADPARPAKPWLGKAFRRLAASDASSAGRLLLALLPAQRAADPHPVAYDLVLGDLATAGVTVSSASAQVDLGDARRPLSEIDFQVIGDLASIARLLAAGPVRRRLGRLALPHPVARIRGDRSRFGALERLIDAPLNLGQLRAAGVRLDPALAMTVAALMIESDWTVGERFTIGHREPAGASPDAYLHVRDGKPLLPSVEPPHGPVASVLVCPGDEVLDALAGATPAAVEGEERPLLLLRQWIARAQSG